MVQIFHYLHSHYRLGGPRIRKPHCVTVYVNDTIIDIRFSRKDYDLMWIMHKVIREEMKLNYDSQIKPKTQ